MGKKKKIIDCKKIGYNKYKHISSRGNVFIVLVYVNCVVLYPKHKTWQSKKYGLKDIELIIK